MNDDQRMMDAVALLHMVNRLAKLRHQLTDAGRPVPERLQRALDSGSRRLSELLNDSDEDLAALRAEGFGS